MVQAVVMSALPGDDNALEKDTAADTNADAVVVEEVSATTAVVLNVVETPTSSSSVTGGGGGSNLGVVLLRPEANDDSIGTNGVVVEVPTWLHLVLLFPLVVWVWDVWEGAVEHGWGHDRKGEQLLTFFLTATICGISIFYMDKARSRLGRGIENGRERRSRRARHLTKLIGFIGIVGTTSAWCVLEKIVEIIVPFHHERVAAYGILVVGNTILVLIYEKYTKSDIFAKLEDLM